MVWPSSRQSVETMLVAVGRPVARLNSAIASRDPYRRWVVEQQLRLDDLPEPMVATTHEAAASVMERQMAFGYTIEEGRLVLEPMILDGAEAVGSMGTDTPIAVLS